MKNDETDFRRLLSLSTKYLFIFLFPLDQCFLITVPPLDIRVFFNDGILSRTFDLFLPPLLLVSNIWDTNVWEEFMEKSSDC